jgi:hypothetical protein
VVEHLRRPTANLPGKAVEVLVSFQIYLVIRPFFRESG